MQPVAVAEKDDADSDQSSEDEPIESHQTTSTATTAVTRIDPVEILDTSPDEVSDEKSLMLFSLN